MHKLKLDPEMLAVESFVPADAAHAAPGTVRAHVYTAQCNGNEPTLNCQETGPGVPTCNDSCYDLCMPTPYAPATCIE